MEEISRSAHFLVVDEGPGRSGSTFLSVAEALAGAGVRRDDISVLGSREFDPASLCAENAVARWRGVSFLSTAAAVNLRFEIFHTLAAEAGDSTFSATRVNGRRAGHKWSA